MIDALLMLNESEIKELELTVGQQRLLSKGINRARSSHLAKLIVEHPKDLTKERSLSYVFVKYSN